MLTIKDLQKRISSKIYCEVCGNLSYSFSLKEFASFHDKVLKQVILDVDDANANANANIYDGQQLTLFNDYYSEYCYMPMLMLYVCYIARLAGNQTLLTPK